MSPCNYKNNQKSFIHSYFKMKQVSVLLVSLALFGSVFCGSIDIIPGEYHLDWEVADGNITVTATAKTLGYVGFGVSPWGTMMEADLVLSGRYANGTGYIQDCYAFADTAPQRDAIQNVVLISATENATHTTVTFTRKLDTQDTAQDRPILNETQLIIWSWGPTDSLGYHGPNRGTVSLNLVAS